MTGIGLIWEEVHVSTITSYAETLDPVDRCDHRDSPDRYSVRCCAVNTDTRAAHFDTSPTDGDAGSVHCDAGAADRDTDTGPGDGNTDARPAGAAHGDADATDRHSDAGPGSGEGDIHAGAAHGDADATDRHGDAGPPDSHTHPGSARCRSGCADLRRQTMCRVSWAQR